MVVIALIIKLELIMFLIYVYGIGRKMGWGKERRCLFNELNRGRKVFRVNALFIRFLDKFLHFIQKI